MIEVYLQKDSHAYNGKFLLLINTDMLMITKRPRRNHAQVLPLPKAAPEAACQRFSKANS